MQAFDFMIPDWPERPDGVGALMTGRRGGVSGGPFGDGMGGGGLNLGLHVGDDPTRVHENRFRLRQVLPAYPAWLSQVHGIGVVDAAHIGQGSNVLADASFSTARAVVCVTMSADCLPVLFSDVEGNVVAAAHAGWRGLAAGVLSGTVAAMREAGAGEILAWLGPAIGPAQFEVGADVLATFQNSGLHPAMVEAAFLARKGRPGLYLADIYQLARLFLARDGVSRIAGGNRCTVTESDYFYSYRRDGVTGRQASLIWRK